MPLNLVHVRGAHEPTRGVVLLVHGARGQRRTCSARRSARPSSTRLVDRWLRRLAGELAGQHRPAAQRLDPRPGGAATTIPPPCGPSSRRPGRDRIKADHPLPGLHLVHDVRRAPGWSRRSTRSSRNAVSLHPVVADGGPGSSSGTRSRSPPGSSPTSTRPGAIVRRAGAPRRSPCWSRPPHHECDNTVCQLVSFTYGSGFPALWRHENLDAGTHDSLDPARVRPGAADVLPSRWADAYGAATSSPTNASTACRTTTPPRAPDGRPLSSS